jgi:signal transduction histidine kinase
MPSTAYILFGIGLIATLSLMLGSAWTMTAFVMTIAQLVVLLILTMKVQTMHRGVGELGRLQSAYEQLDNQAKLIIRTDLELHRAQEELDRRLASLMSLHQLGRQLEVNLHPDEIYGKLDARVVTNFGFSKGLLGLCASFQTVEWKSLVGVEAPAARDLGEHLVKSRLLKELLSQPGPRLLQASTVHDPLHQKLLDVLGVPVLLIAGIVPHTGPAGVLLLGRMAAGVPSSKADEELVSILTNQLAAAVENSALYESTWLSQQAAERKVQERTHELAAANDRLIRMNKAKSDFVSAVSHELRTPLAAIKGYAALLGSGQFGALAAPQGERIAKIEKHADLLTMFINNLLDIARIESGRITMEQRAIPLDEFLATVQDVVHPQMEAKHIKYIVDRDGVKELVGDGQHLQRVFVNLLSNAIKYTPDKGTIRVGLSREGDQVVASVTDSGCGIAAADLQKLFQEFYRANDPINQVVRGTGLGLALVKRIVEAHHGQISVASTPGQGSTFTVRLPAAAPEDGAGASAGASLPTM